MPDHNYFSNLIWQIADLLRGPYRPPQYERVMLPMTVLRRFDCVLVSTKSKVLAEHQKLKGGKVEGDALDRRLAKVAGQRFHNHSPLDFEKLKGDPDNIEKHLVSYIKGFSANVRTIFDFFEFEVEIEKMREANILYLVVSKFCDVDLHPNAVPNEQMGLIFENLIRRFNELANETAGDHFTPRDAIRLTVDILFINDDKVFESIRERIYEELDQIIQASSMVECINSILRPYLNNSKNQVTQEFLNLFMFYHNHRRYHAGKRKGKTPMEILTGKEQKDDWITLLQQEVREKKQLLARPASFRAGQLPLGFLRRSFARGCPPPSIWRKLRKSRMCDFCRLRQTGHTAPSLGEQPRFPPKGGRPQHWKGRQGLTLLF